MGASESTRRKVSFGLDEEEKVTVIQGVKLSGDLLQRLRGGTGSVKPTPPQPASHKPDPGSGSGPTAAEAQEELRKKFELEQTRVQDQLARLAQREREAAEAMAVAAGAGRDAHDDLNPALLLERGKSHEELMKARQLPAELDARAKQLKKKEAELQHLAAFYKEQLQVLEKKVMSWREVARILTTTSTRLSSTKRQPQRPRLISNPYRPRPSVRSCRPRCYSATDRTRSRPFSVPAWPSSTWTASRPPRRKLAPGCL
ncbi:MICOS complex subunit mic25-b isoform X3 [Esox lucius]|uniref:MICOS complex subunit mic25-b isoform X3 n=1 Tax=Esox lucius TaxID=8010 RepID=UPI001476EFFF|nr:MICOS complex subunit mic25-b isoform X3 [Esox lucius]